MSKSAKFSRLEDDKLWRLASEVALYAYAQLENFPEEENYGMQSRLRDHAFDLTGDLAEAAGSLDPRDKAHYYGHALRDAFGVRNVLVMANKTGILSVEPATFVKLDRLVEGVSAQVTVVSDDIPQYLQQFSMDERGGEA